jgi:hypothetical protein
MVEYVPLPFFLHNAVDLELCLKVASLALPAATTPAAAYGQPEDDHSAFSLADKLAAQGELLVTAQVFCIEHVFDYAPYHCLKAVSLRNNRVMSH